MRKLLWIPMTKAPPGYTEVHAGQTGCDLFRAAKRRRLVLAPVVTVRALTERSGRKMRLEKAH